MASDEAASRPVSRDGSAQPRDASETTPLLAGGLAPDGDTEASTLMPQPEVHGQESPRPSSKLHSVGFQLFLLCYARVTEPIAFFSIFPYIAQMVSRNGNLPPADVGLYSGLIESLFSLTQMVMLLPLGRLSDKVGRKPILLYSLIGMSIAPALFGLAQTIPQMIVFRCLAGAVSGSSLIIRTVIAEVTENEGEGGISQARAYSYFAFAGNIGIFVGPLVGGALADPVDQYPGVFGGSKFLEKYPYALAGVIPGLFALSASILNAVFLPETLHKGETHDQDARGKQNGTAASQTAEAGPNDQAASDEAGTAAAQIGFWRLLHAPGVPTALLTYSHTMLLAFAFTALLPVVLYTPTELGGLSFSPLQISVYMAVQGASQALWLLLVFPPLQARVGTKGVLWVCAIFYPVFFLMYPLVNALLREGQENGSTSAMVWFWIVGAVVALVGPGVSMAFTATQLALNDAAPSNRVLGTLNAVAMTVSSGIRSVVPGVTTAVYAVGVKRQILGGHLAWIVLTPLAGALIFMVKALPKDKPRRAQNGNA